MASVSRTRQNLQPNEELGFYCRVAKLLLSVGTYTLRELFVHIVGDVVTYLQDPHRINQIKSAKYITTYQEKILIPPGGVADVDKFDITLLSALLLNFCSLQDKNCIKDIRQHRNELCHSHDAHITKDGFDSTWKQISDTLCKIAQLRSPDFQVEVKKEIADLKNAPIDVSREQQYFMVLVEYCLSDSDFQRDIITQQTEANRILQQLMKRLSLLEQQPQVRQIQQTLNDLKDVMKKGVLSNEEMSSVCTSLMEEVNKTISKHMSSLQTGIRADLQRMSKSLADAADLLRTDVQENRQHWKQVEKKLDKLSQKQPVVVKLIDDALLDKVTGGMDIGGMNFITDNILQTWKPEDKDITKPTQKTEMLKSESKRQNRQRSYDQQIKVGHEIVTEFQNFNVAMSELFRTAGNNTKDTRHLNRDDKPRRDIEMGAKYKEEFEKVDHKIAPEFQNFNAARSESFRTAGNNTKDTRHLNRDDKPRRDIEMGAKYKEEFEKVGHEIATEFQNFNAARSESFRTGGNNTKDTRHLNRDDKPRRDIEMGAKYKEESEKVSGVSTGAAMSELSRHLNRDAKPRRDIEIGAEYREEIEKGVALDLARGVGPDTVLLLDTSCSMERDENFVNMMQITRQILQGIVEENVSKVLEENIAIVTFGGCTSIRQHLTIDQSCWITALEDIQSSGPGGPADLCKGLQMCEAAIKVNRNPTEKHKLCISPRIVLITAGNLSDPSDPLHSFKNREKARHQAYSLVDILASNNHRVFCVPLCNHGSPRYDFLEKLAHQASGSIVRPDDIQYITRYHRKIFWALRFWSCHPGIPVSEGTFIAGKLKTTSKLPFTDDDVEYMMEIIANPDTLGYTRSRPKKGIFEESYDALPPLGTRVIHGEHWRENVFKEHHCGPGTGTVIGQEADRVWVEWDGCEDGKHYLYKYGLNDYYEVRVHDRPRIPEEGKTFLVGCCITRIEWEEDVQEDPLGYGLVFMSSPTFGTFGVRWKNGDPEYNTYDSVYYALEEFPSPWCFGPEEM